MTPAPDMANHTSPESLLGPYIWSLVNLNVVYNQPHFDRRKGLNDSGENCDDSDGNDDFVQLCTNCILPHGNT